MQDVLSSIARRNPELNAVVSVRSEEALMADAKRADERLARGQARPLEGIPLGVKDLEHAAGLATTFGSVPFKDNLAPDDSTQVARLKAAGAIVVGKTNTPEFGSAARTKNVLFGVTRNPWDPKLSPGGSSGGAAAALVGNLMPLVTASDAGGSIRIPAACVGAVGFKPTLGRVPLGPKPRWDGAELGCYGPLCKTVEDAALVLDQVVGPCLTDPRSLPHPGVRYREAVQQAPRPLKIAYSADLGYAVVEPEVAAVVRDAIQTFASLGHEVHTIQGGPPEPGEAWSMLINREDLAELQADVTKHEGQFGRGFLRELRRLGNFGLETYEHLMRLRGQTMSWSAQLHSDYDLLMTPTLPCAGLPARGALPETIDGKPVNPAGVASFTMPFNLTLQPAISIRAGMSSGGLPIGLQIVGKRLDDLLVLQAARAFERERPWHPKWPDPSARLGG